MQRLPLLLIVATSFGCHEIKSFDAPDAAKARPPDASVTVDAGVDVALDGGSKMEMEADASVDAGETMLDAGEQDTGVEPFEGCAGTGDAYDKLNAFWTAFDETYALFDIRLPGGSWDEVGREACAQLSSGIGEDALFDLLISMAERLDDGHVQLEASDLGREEDGWVSEYPYYEELYSLEINVEDNYLDGDLTWAAEDWFAWGTIGSVGYISITSMEGFTPNDDEDEDVDAARDAMESALTDLDGSIGLIIDVRANEGGWDTVALEISRWVAGSRTVAWSEQVRDGPAHDDFSEWEDTFVEAARPGAFSGPVILLTSGGTFSAAETFALAMRVREDVTIIGERSSGHFSDLLDHELPGGWDLSLSGERYRAADGVIYESLGVPVDVEVALDVQALAAGQDVMLEAALSQLGN